MDVLEQRQKKGLPVFGLPNTFVGRRWLSEYSGSGDFALAHGEPRPHSSPLITVGILTKPSVGAIDVYGTLGTRLVLKERSRNDPAFQFETRDQAVIEHEMRAVPGPDAWTSPVLELDGSAHEFRRAERAEDWIAFTEVGDEWLWVHAEQPEGGSVSIVTIHDVASYLDE